MKSLSQKGVAPLPPEQHALRIDDVASSLGIDRMLDIATEAYHTMSTRYRVYSMSKRWDNLSMWHWYASKHFGYCLEFNNDPSFGDVREVIYDSSYALDMTDIRHATPNWFFYKSPDWSNEEEVRLVAPRSLGPVVPFRPDLLNRVILGKEMAESNVALVQEWAAQRIPPLPVARASWDPIHLRLVTDPETDAPTGTPLAAES